MGLELREREGERELHLDTHRASYISTVLIRFCQSKFQAEVSSLCSVAAAGGARLHAVLAM